MVAVRYAQGRWKVFLKTASAALGIFAGFAAILFASTPKGWDSVSQNPVANVFVPGVAHADITTVSGSDCGADCSSDCGCGGTGDSGGCY